MDFTEKHIKLNHQDRYLTGLRGISKVSLSDTTFLRGVVELALDDAISDEFDLFETIVETSGDVDLGFHSGKYRNSPVLELGEMLYKLDALGSERPVSSYYIADEQ